MFGFPAEPSLVEPEIVDSSQIEGAKLQVTEFAANFTAIDFETANHRRDSACQLAAVRVRDGKIADSAMWMIKPKPFFFTRANIGIHGITPQQVATESEFGDLWDEIATTLGDDCLVAHNAAFDLGVLIGCLNRHQKTVPEFQFTCTRAIARRTWPGRRRYGLKPLSDWLGVRFQHHDALEDSIACAKILLAAGIDKQADTLPALEKKLRLSRGSAGPWGYKGPAYAKKPRRKPEPDTRRSSVSRNQPLDLPIESFADVRESTTAYLLPPKDEPPVATPRIDIQRLLIRADFIRPLDGKSIVFSGRLKTLTAENAELLAARSGGSCQQSVTTLTSYLVIGDAIDEQATNVAPDEEQRKAKQLQHDGQPICILSEAEFLGLMIAPTTSDQD